MRWLSRLRSVGFHLLFPGRAEQRVDEEARSHMDLLIDEKMRSGMPEADARRQARLELGGIEQLKHSVREQRHGARLEALYEDIRIGTRVLLKQRAFLLLAVVTVGIGVGSMTAIYSFSRFLFNQNVAGVNRPEELALISVHYPGVRNRNWSGYPHYLELKERQSAFTDLAHYFRFETVYSSNELAEEVSVEVVSGSYFSVLGVSPALGRTLSADDDLHGGELVAMIGYALWQDRFGGSPDTIGKVVSLNGIPVRIVGVAPRNFIGVDLDYLSSPEFWVTLHFPVQAPGLRSIPPEQFLRLLVTSSGPIIGRFRPGVDVAAAEANLNGLIGGLSVAGDRSRVERISVAPAREARIAPNARARTSSRLNIFMAVSALVLLGSCFNVANFLITRSTARHREFAVRLSLGATRLRVAQQLFVEALLLATAAGASGVMIAFMLLRAFGSEVSGFLGIPIATTVSLDMRALGFALALLAASAVLFGVIPAALASMRDPAGDLKSPQPGWSWVGIRFSPRQVLLAIQVAISTILAVTAGLYAHSLYNISQVDSGYPAGSMLFARVNYRSIPSADGRRAFLRTLLDRLGEHPRVDKVSAGPAAPFTFIEFKVSAPENPSLMIDVGSTQAAPGFFDAMGIRVVAGREFDGSDYDTEQSVIINSALAASLWPGRQPIGRVLDRGGRKRSVIGIAEFDRCYGLLGQSGPCVWEPFTTVGTGTYLRIRIDGDASSLLPDLRRIAKEIHPDVAILDANTVDSYIAALTANQRISAILSAALAFVGIGLVAIGCFSLFASMVKDSAREIAIRLAVGATPWNLIFTIVTRGLLLVLLGTAAGLSASLFVTKTVADQFFGVDPSDTTTLVATALGMIVVGLVATYWPARAALRREPAAVLREN
jgi:predicted permease